MLTLTNIQLRHYICPTIPYSLSLSLGLLAQSISHFPFIQVQKVKEEKYFSTVLIILKVTGRVMLMKTVSGDDAWHQYVFLRMKILQTMLYL